MLRALLAAWRTRHGVPLDPDGLTPTQRAWADQIVTAVVRGPGYTVTFRRRSDGLLWQHILCAYDVRATVPPLDDLLGDAMRQQGAYAIPGSV